MSAIRCENLRLDDTYTVIHNDIDLKNLMSSAMSADCYVHFTGRLSCRYAVIEVKIGRSVRLSKALKQLEETVKFLINKGKRIDRVIIYMIGSIAALERRRYEVINNILFFKRSGKRKPCLVLKRYRVEVIRRSRA